MQYVRKKPKGFGRNAQIEGDVREGARTLLVEDLTTDGRSKINFCQALRNAGAIVDHVFVNFYYDIFPESKKILARPEREAALPRHLVGHPRGGEEGRLPRSAADRRSGELSARARASGPRRTAVFPLFHRS